MKNIALAILAIGILYSAREIEKKEARLFFALLSVIAAIAVFIV